jgi:aconitate hydratase
MSNQNLNTYGTLSTLSLTGTPHSGKPYHYHSLPDLAQKFPRIKTLPFSLKILLENLLRHEDGISVQKKDIEALCNWDPKALPDTEIQFMPARTLLQDFTGVPAVADLAAMRDAIQSLGGNPSQINPLQPAALVIDHSVQVDHFGGTDSLAKNVKIEFERNEERYQFLKWGQTAFQDFLVVPPGMGIVHQVNLENLASVAMSSQKEGKHWVYPDTLVGTDSHTTMINGLGVLGWGVGGIEAEAAMLGQPISMLIPQVVGFELKGRMKEGTTATDLVLTVTHILRKKGVVGKFVEFFGDGLKHLSLADRATLSNMAPEYGATVGIFPVDERTTEYLRLTGRDEEQVQLVEDYYKTQGMWYSADDVQPEFTESMELNLSDVVPSLAGPIRPQDQVKLSDMPSEFKKALPAMLEKGGLKSGEDKKVKIVDNGKTDELEHGSVVIASITSCTNTSNPVNLITAGLLAKKAVEKGLSVKPWIKTSLAPGSRVVTDYFKSAGLMTYFEALRFHTVGYGCTTCIGNSGPLPEHVASAVQENDLVVASVLSGNRNFEGRINPHTRANYLASPPLVVAYALAGNVKIDLNQDPLGIGSDGQPVYLKDIWPTSLEVNEVVTKHVSSKLFQNSYSDVLEGDENWKSLESPKGAVYAWDEKSTYIKKPPFFENMSPKPALVKDIKGARVLALLGDSVTTDHISPAGAIPQDSPAGQYLIAQGVEPRQFNSFGSRRGNHEVMIRGTFGNIRLRNLLAPGTEGGWTRFLPEETEMSIYDASVRYQAAGTPLIVLAGKEYGTGSSRDWAAKGTTLLGVSAVITESFERIHRSNLIGMGVLPLQFTEGENAQSLGLSGRETFDIEGLSALKPCAQVKVVAHKEDGSTKTFNAVARIDTPNELEYYFNGGILHYVLRQMLKKA